MDEEKVTIDTSELRIELTSKESGVLRGTFFRYFIGAMQAMGYVFSEEQLEELEDYCDH